MGAYLSTPNREKHSVDYAGGECSYGASSMQGWRISQEDAHNCCPDFDPERKCLLFAVYDGHGGAEVASYTAEKFPDFLKKNTKYKEGSIAQALEDTFMTFDKHLTNDEVIETLKQIAGVEEAEEDVEDEENEVAGLFEEADMPLEKLMERYGATNKSFDKLREKGDDFQSPALRPKKDAIDKIEADHIKQTMSNKLMNGDGDGVDGSADGDVTCSEKTAVKKEKVLNGSSEADNSVHDTTTSSVNKSDKINNSAACNDALPDRVKNNVCDSATDGKKDKLSVDAQPDSTQNSTSQSSAQICSSSSSSSSKDCRQDAVNSTNATPAAAKTTVLGRAEVTSSDDSSPLFRSKADDDELEVLQPGACGDAPVTSSAAKRSSPLAVGGSSSSVAGGSSSSAAGGSSSAVASSAGGSSSDDKPEEPSSSTGRRRSGRTGVIPAPGEDETSEEDDDDDSEDSDIDELEITESDSDDDDMAGFDVDDDDDDDDDLAHHPVFGQEEPGADSGCTAVVAVLRQRELYVANAGDSRCVVCRAGKAIDMSVDHKPEDELERQRIEKAGGQVTEDNRVNGGLNLSRAIGDHAYKRNTDLPLSEQMITALPDVKSLTLTDEDEFMVIACDGIWNVMSSQDVCVFVRDRFKAGVDKISDIVEQMFDFCIAPDTSGDGTGCDNMTCIIVKFASASQESSSAATSSGGAAVKRTAEDDGDVKQETKKAKDGD